MSFIPRPDGERPSPHALWVAMASFAVVLPTLVAFNVSPSATFLNQAAAFVGWGGFLLVLGAALPRVAWPASTGSTALLVSLAVLFLAALGASAFESAPWSLSLSSAGAIASAALTVAVAAAAARFGLASPAFRAFCIALVVAGVACSAIGLVQVFAPAWPDGTWVAGSAIPGRATGNLRQPNHLSSLLLWSIVAVVWLGEARTIGRAVAALLAVVFIYVVVLSASRTGAIGMLTLLAWGALDRRLSKQARMLLVLAPLVYGACWWGMTVWANASHHLFGGQTRFGGSGDISSSRFGIWSNTLSLIESHPWFGVGWGEFNFAWTLTPFPGRPVAFFDHTHNLVLNFAVELGIPLAAVVLALMLFALWRALQNALADGRVDGIGIDVGTGIGASTGAGTGGNARASAATRARSKASIHTDRLPVPDAARPSTSAAPVQRAAFVMVVMVGVHSLLEYPLWYAYFLLPAAFAFGLCLERPDARSAALAARAEPDATRPFVLASMVLILGGALALFDYLRVVAIFAPPAGAASLEARIADGRNSVLFSHHADYAAATVAEHPGSVMSAFDRAPYYLLDARLMMAWARALNEAGETDKARYVAERLREFHNENAAEFFAPCEAAGSADRAKAEAAAGPASAASAPSSLPFQCMAPARALRFEDFR